MRLHRRSVWRVVIREIISCQVIVRHKGNPDRSNDLPDRIQGRAIKSPCWDMVVCAGRIRVVGQDGILMQIWIRRRLIGWWIRLSHMVLIISTSPALLYGALRRATGIALKRYPRNTYFIATKLSNFAPSTWSREASIAMYRNSFKELQVDYIDYLLLHGVGMGNGMKEYEERYLNNGVLDFLLEEREAGRIRNLGFSYHGDMKSF